MRKIYTILCVFFVLVITQAIIENKLLVKERTLTPVPAQPAGVESTIATPDNKDYGDDKNGMHVGLIKSISTDFVGVDYVNENSQVHTIPIAPGTTVSLQTYAKDPEGGQSWNEQVSLEEFIKIYLDKTDLYQADKLLYWVTIKDGKVVDISEQYLP